MRETGANVAAFLARVRREQRERTMGRRRAGTFGVRSTTPPTFQAAGVFADGTGDISPEWPAHQAADIGLLFVVTLNEAVATPADWNAVANGNQGVGVAAGTSATRLQVFWRRAASAAETAALVLDGGARQGGVILTFRGCAPSGDPINASAGDASADANTTPVSIPGATTTVANCLVVAACSKHKSAGTQSGEANASLTSLTERFDFGASTEFVAVVTGIKAAAGLYSATTATLASSSRQAHVSLALLPA